MSNEASIGDVTSRLTLDSASFDAKLEKSGQGLDRHADLTEKASARARAAWEKELLAQDKAQRSLDNLARAKELAALKSDILTRTLDLEAAATAKANQARDWNLEVQGQNRAIDAEQQMARAKELSALKSDILSRSLVSEAAAQTAAGMAAGSAEHGTITSMQATSASLRALEGGFNNNLRSMERWVSQSELVSNAAKGMFQFVGAGTFGYLLFEAGEKAVKAIETARDMADTIRQAFGALHTEAQSANNTLAITNDNLEMELAKLEKKPGNGLQLALDEARQSADQLSDSLSKDIAKVTELIAKNKVGLLGELMGQAGTKDSAAIVIDVQSQIAAVKNANQPAIDYATDHGATQQNIVDMKAYEMSQLEAVYAKAAARIKPILHGYQQDVDMFLTSGGGLGRDERGNVAILGGFMQQMDDEQKQLGESYRSDTLRGKIAPLKDAGSLDAANAAREASAKRYREMELEFDQEQHSHAKTIKETYDFWQKRIDAFTDGSERYVQIMNAQAKLAVEGARASAEKIAKFRSDAKGVSALDIGPTKDRIAGMMLRDRLKGTEGQTSDMVDSNQLAIVDAHNLARAREADIMDKAGQSMTRYAAAVELAGIHTKEFNATMLALQAIRSDRALVAGINPTKENNRALAESQAQIASLTANREIQVRNDNRQMNGPDSSALVGAKDALDQFVLSTRNASEQMRDFVGNMLNSLNGQLTAGITGQKTNFSGMADGMLRGAASMGLSKAEGSILSMFGLGGKKAPTGEAGDPLHVVMAGAGGAGGVGGAISSVASKATGGGGAGFFGSLLSGLLPHFAAGGPIGADTWAMVGERGPELFHSGGGGSIVPNHKLSDVTSGGEGGTSIQYSIDARGTDPVQTEQRVRSAIVASHQSAVTQASKNVQQRAVRTPSRSR